MVILGWCLLMGSIGVSLTIAYRQGRKDAIDAAVEIFAEERERQQEEAQDWLGTLYDEGLDNPFPRHSTPLGFRIAVRKRLRGQD